MYQNTRFDLQDYSPLGLAPSGQTWGNPLTVLGEDITRAGTKFYAIGHGISPQTFGARWGVISRAEVDIYLDALATSGVNMLSLIGMEQYGIATSGTYAGRQIGCFEIGYQFATVSTRNWSVGERCWTQDGSGIRRVYECITAGVGSGSTGPTGAGSDVTNGATHWKFLWFVGSTYSETFFAGSSSQAGLDYFMDACGRRGIYVALRFNHWDMVISGQTGYPLNGGGNLSGYYSAWVFDGEYSTPTVRTYMRNHIATFLDRRNTVNGKRYGDDHTLAIVNTWNEMGIAYWYYTSTSTTSPSANTFDKFCSTGSSTSAADPANPTALYVAAWDSKWLAWYQATFSAATPNGDYGKANTLPCDGYTGAMGSNVAARDAYRAGSTGNDYAWRKRVNQFLRETEATMVGDMTTWLRTKSAHVLHAAGQSNWMFPTSAEQAHLCDIHYYSNNASTSSNTVTLTATTAPTAGMAYTSTAGGTLTFTGMPSTDTTAHPLNVGDKIRWTKTSAPAVTGVSTIATTGDPWTCTGVDADYATAAADIGGTNINCTVILPTQDVTWWEFVAEPPGNNTSTRTHVWMYGANEANADIASGWAGQNNYGGYEESLRSGHNSGKPKVTTELGNRSIAHPISTVYPVVYTLFDLLQGGSGWMRFSWVGSAVTTVGEHILPGDGSAMLSTQLCALMARVVSKFPTEDATQASYADIDDWYSKKNTTDLYTGTGCGWPNLVTTLSTGRNQSWPAFMERRLRLKVDPSTSAKTNVTYTHGNSGWTHPTLNSTTTGRLYHQRDIGTLVYESSKFKIIVGRIRPTTDTTECTGMTLNVVDSTMWYGMAAWITLDGSDLGVGSSVLFHWMYPREEQQAFRRHEMSTRTQYIEMLDGNLGASSNQQPGVVLRNGLKVSLSCTNPALRAYHLERYGNRKTYPSFYSGTNLFVYPGVPLLVIA